MSDKRVSDANLGRLEYLCESARNSQVYPSVDIGAGELKMLLAEVRARRAAAVTEDEREAIKFVVKDLSLPPFASWVKDPLVDAYNKQKQAAIAVLDRLIGAGK